MIGISDAKTLSASAIVSARLSTNNGIVKTLPVKQNDKARAEFCLENMW